MQLEFLEIAFAGLILIPLVLLTLLHLLDIQKSEDREQKTAVYGFLTYILLFSYFILNWFVVVEISVIVLVYATALTFLPVWTLSLSKPEYLESLKIPFAIIFLIIWCAYVGTRLLTTFAFIPYFLAAVFALSLVFLILSLLEDMNYLIIIIGLALVYLERAWTLFDYIVEAGILTVGLWLVFVWFIISRRKTSP
jgi:hypothetical protein